MEGGFLMTSNIYFLRHGEDESLHSVHKVHPYPSCELSKIGKESISNNIEKLKDIKVDVILCSPIKRALQSAQIIANGLDVPLIVRDEFSEWCPPSSIYGKSVKGYSNEYSAWRLVRHKYPNSFVQDGESMNEVYKRIVAGKDIIEEFSQEYSNIVIVSHLVYLRGLIGLFNHESFNNGINLFEPNNKINLSHAAFIKVKT